MEPFEAAAAKARENGLYKVLTGFYDQVAGELPDKHFDLIVANDVIEHMEQPWQFLKAITKKMKSDASIVLSIPNVRYFDNLIKLLFKKDWKYEDCGILDITHLSFFTKKSSIRLLEENGFVIEKIEGINPIYNSSIKRKILYAIFKVVFGSDIRFQQFGVRARLYYE